MLFKVSVSKQDAALILSLKLRLHSAASQRQWLIRDDEGEDEVWHLKNSWNKERKAKPGEPGV